MLTLQSADKRSVELHIYWEWKRGTFLSESRSRLRSVAPEAKSTPLMKRHWSMCLQIVQWNSRSPAGRGFPRLLTEIESEGQGIPPNILSSWHTPASLRILSNVSRSQSVQATQ